MRRQAAVGIVRELGRDLVIADLFGGNLVTRSPFRARAMQRRERLPDARRDQHTVGGAVWANVPWLPDASPDLLVRIASSEDRVEELRAATARSLRRIEQANLGEQAQAITDLSEELAEAGAKLRRDLTKSVAIETAGTSALAMGSVLLGAAPPTAALGLSAVIAGLGASLPSALKLRRDKRSSAYAFWMARPRM